VHVSRKLVPPASSLLCQINLGFFAMVVKAMPFIKKSNIDSLPANKKKS